MGRAELERAVAAVFKRTGLDRMCVECGGLNAMSSAVVILQAGEEPRTCGTCGLLLGPDGRARGHRGDDGVFVRVIRIHPRPVGRFEADGGS